MSNQQNQLVTQRAVVAQWLRLELRCDRPQIRSPLYMSFRFGRNLAPTIYMLARCSKKLQRATYRLLVGV